MNIDQQIQELIDDAPQDGSTPALVATIAPVLKFLASQLRHTQYYIVQTLDQNWAITALENRAQPGLEKNVIYAFCNLKDVSAGPYPMNDPQMMALPIPVTHILFQMLATEMIHSVIFFDAPSNTAAGTEIQREQLSELIESHLLQNQQRSEATLPPDIA
ncbi:hypothetical protein [Stenomitos frigidus]|uniref:Uncharacterized protein n=1 Tax=Stenomitos frigidus ULC18 TaxID=2107698 RepID=A0A2T1ELJ7_9CYAN|nr:hypothetical protein [Stenomitos frigidus]PSB33606.1 hypothetical protein C7B82_03730 [Stenomitos frigidus ULC18]